MNRRQFLRTSSAAMAGMLAAGAGAGCANSGGGGARRSTAARATTRPIGANSDIRVAVIGFNQQGKGHIKAYQNIPGVRLVALCDVDEQVLNKTADALARDGGTQVARYRDLRKLLDDKEIDAVSMALPIRWHALAAIWACQAGKDVYVEKPVSHSIWEGRKIVEAARKYRRMVNVGLNNRSRPAQEEVYSFVRSGQIGPIDHVRVWDYKRRKSIGKVTGPQRIPQYVDYDLWSGPGPLLPLMRQNLHYDWHWQWSHGAGEIANNGVHHLDMARWALAKNHLPQTVMSFGGRYGYVDDGQTPNTMVAVYDYDGIPVVYEARGLPSGSSGDGGSGDGGAETMDDLDVTLANGTAVRLPTGKPGSTNGVALFCEGGYCVNTTVYDNDGNVIKQWPREPFRPQAHFIDGVRSRNVRDLRPDIEDGHLSTCLCHMGNTSVQCGEAMSFKRAQERLRDSRHATAAIERMRDHLRANGVDTSSAAVTVGPTLTMDSRSERFTGPDSDRANWFIKDSYRAPFIVPEKV